MVEVDECWCSSYGEAICSLYSGLLGFPPFNFVRVGGSSVDINHTKFGLLIKVTLEDCVAVNWNNGAFWFEHCCVRTME